jgi:spore germination protein YaaH
MRPLTLIFAFCAVLAAQPKTLFYMNDSPASIRSFQANAERIDVIAPTVYSVDAAGLVWGKPDSRVLETARKFHVAVMPLIVNPGFKQDMTHALMTSVEARKRMNATLLAECRKYGYYGIQFDFENVNYLDRDLLTAMVQETSAALGREGFKLSIATVPNEGDEPGKSDYTRWVFQNWRGAFDLKKLAPYVDFVSLMTYDQHTRNTPPGPVAGMQWVERLVAYAESQMPKEKTDQLRWQRLEPSKKLAEMLLNHLEGILNYCREPVRFGVVEAVNGNIKALLRRGREYKNLRYLLLKAQRLAALKTEFLVLRKAA